MIAYGMGNPFSFGAAFPCAAYPLCYVGGRRGDQGALIALRFIALTKAETLSAFDRAAIDKSR